MTCATCEHFHIKDHPDQAALGRGHCVGYLASLLDFVSWDAPQCPLYRRAKQMAPRERWMERFAAAGQGGDSSAASSAARHGTSEGAPPHRHAPIKNEGSERL